MSKVIQNIKSFHRTFSELEMMIKDKKNEPILFALTETSCNKYNLKNAVSLESFQQNEMESREKLRGGVGFYIQSDLLNKRVFKFQENNGYVLIISTQIKNKDCLTTVILRI